MAFNNDINDFLVPAQDASLYQLVYNQIYGGRTGCTVVVNGTTVQMGANSSIDILVETISGGTGCLLSGDRPYVYGDSPQYKYVPQTFVSVWDTSRTSTGSSTATRITLPLISTGSYNFIVEWGDGSTDRITTWNQAEVTHTYAAAGVYQLTITGTINGFRFNNGGDRLKLLSILKWGTGFRLGATDAHFFGCQNLDLSEVEDVLNLAGTTSFFNTFSTCNNLSTINNSNLWDTSNITNMHFTFNVVSGVGKFNSDISNWDMSKVTTLRSTFQNQLEFNQDISTKVARRSDGVEYIAWDTLNVTEFQFVLNAGTGNVGKFNQNIGNWNTSKGVNMSVMFQNQESFNQDISTKVVTVGNKTYRAWDTLNATNLQGIIGVTTGTSGKGKFNQNIGNWNTSKVTAMNGMLQGQPSFNHDISTKVVTVGGSTYTAWDTKEVTLMSSFFANFFGTVGQFNQNIGNWNTSKVTTMNSMFSNQPEFNQDISTKTVTVSGNTYTAWDMLNVTTLSGMFGISAGKSGVFNQNIGNWNTSKVTSINSLFQNQPEFNQDLSTKTVTVGASTYTAWDMLNVTTMRYTFFNNIINPTSQFNQNIGNWNTVKVTDMTAMLFNTVKFNQNISSWKVNLVTAFNSTTVAAETFADYIGLSQTNYDALLIGWASRAVRPNISISFGTTKRTTASNAAVTTLTSAPNNWTIIDGGLV